MTNKMLLAALFLLALAWAIRGVIPFIMLAIIYAIVTWPLVERFNRRLPKGLAILAVHAGLMLAMLAMVAFVWPLAYAQWQALVPDLPAAAQTVFAQLSPEVQARLATEFQNIDLTVASWAKDALQTGTVILRSTAAVFGALILIPALGAYFQLDAPRYSVVLNAVLPEHLRGEVSRVSEAIADSIGSFFRGQLIVSLLVGLLVYVVLALLGIRHAAAIALLTTVFDLVPYLGGVAAFAPSLLFALMGGGILKAVIVCVALLAVFEIEAQILSPQIIGPATKLPGSTVIVSLLCGSALFGILGLYLAVPTVAACVAAFRVVVNVRRPGRVLPKPAPRHRRRV